MGTASGNLWKGLNRGKRNDMAAEYPIGITSSHMNGRHRPEKPSVLMGTAMNNMKVTEISSEATRCWTTQRLAAVNQR
jgi:hypothetical protein